ncbi:flagellar basal body L-ring protein FlgH [Algicola sagamiensis]|uniref:flagellar basal body L-ring protein FlgH n=1 Tax=Algicola sagamiensis TaxID=163869 RepID=UPI00036BBB04|nr:flagellar basal body L-ring protein FlgH [Algicola sagamiensis]
MQWCQERNRFWRIIIFILVVVGLSGCASSRYEPMPDDPFYAPVLPEENSQARDDNGSLYQASVSSGLYTDTKARRVGDIITVMLQESTSASKSAKTETDKESKATINPVTGFGAQPIAFKEQAIQLGMNATNEFSGESKADQSNNLNGSISVHVLRVLKNGNLIIRGEKWLTLNNGDEYIRLTGMIRSDDIDASNTIQSSKVANARIEYSGKGALAKGQEQGWLSKFFSNVLWPF